VDELKEPRFWDKPIDRLSRAQWEALCDGCGQCCLHKLEDEDTGAIYRTNVACRLLDLKSGGCSDYRHRKAQVPDCLRLTPRLVLEVPWLPKTCAYRLVHFKQDLYWWHPLVSGDPETVHQAGISARGRVIPEDQVEDITTRVVDWFA
jgi:uncharacterized cysteine cluster protein YcgN (CxxCxxCC family)